MRLNIVTSTATPGIKSVMKPSRTQVAYGLFKYFIAIDLGTHGSGFAYASAVDSDSSVKTFEYWPGQPGPPAPKTRTALLYEHDNLAKPIAWGWEAITMYADLPEDQRANFVLLEHFKLYLMPSDFKGLPSLPPGLTVRKLVADYLKCLLDLIDSTLDAHYGSRYDHSAVRWCITVPAGLSQSSMTTMREAAMDAGIISTLQATSLTLATEPEAAALAAQQRRDSLGCKTGGRFMIIDMGGGTVDMTIHQVESVVGQDLALSELTHRECLPEGATRVDKRFLRHLAEYLGVEAYEEWAADVENAKDLQDLVYNAWETCKCCYDTTSKANRVNLPYSFVWSLPDDARAKLEASGYSDKLVLSQAEMTSFFQPSLDKVIATARKMLDHVGSVDNILLVGGFSSSRFAMRTLRAALEAPGRSVITPVYNRTAVLEGGVWFARYPSSIAARCSNMTYGVCTGVPWRAGAPSKVWVEEFQGYRCLEGFRRYVARDELVKTGSVVSHSFTPMYRDQLGAEFEIYGSLAENPRYITEESMVKVATVSIDIPPGSYTNPGDYCLTTHFSFGEAQISVRCVDEQTGRERNAVLLFDSSEVTKENLVSLAARKE